MHFITTVWCVLSASQEWAHVWIHFETSSEASYLQVVLKEVIVTDSIADTQVCKQCFHLHCNHDCLEARHHEVIPLLCNHTSQLDYMLTPIVDSHFTNLSVCNLN